MTNPLNKKLNTNELHKIAYEFCLHYDEWEFLIIKHHVDKIIKSLKDYSIWANTFYSIYNSDERYKVWFFSNVAPLIKENGFPMADSTKMLTVLVHIKLIAMNKTNSDGLSEQNLEDLLKATELENSANALLEIAETLRLAATNMLKPIETGNIKSALSDMQQIEHAKQAIYRHVQLIKEIYPFQDVAGFSPSVVTFLSNAKVH